MKTFAAQASPLRFVTQRVGESLPGISFEFWHRLFAKTLLSGRLFHERVHCRSHPQKACAPTILLSRHCVGGRLRRNTLGRLAPGTCRQQASLLGAGQSLPQCFMKRAGRCTNSWPIRHTAWLATCSSCRPILLGRTNSHLSSAKGLGTTCSGQLAGTRLNAEVVLGTFRQIG
jgi:hypothetical protein